MDVVDVQATVDVLHTPVNVRPTENVLIVEYGSATQVFGAPRHEYTRSLFEAAPGRHFKFGGAQSAVAASA